VRSERASDEYSAYALINWRTRPPAVMTVLQTSMAGGEGGLTLENGEGGPGRAVVCLGEQRERT
jgi:hypothetical protein